MNEAEAGHWQDHARYSLIPGSAPAIALTRSVWHRGKAGVATRAGCRSDERHRVRRIDLARRPMMSQIGLTPQLQEWSNMQFRTHHRSAPRIDLPHFEALICRRRRSTGMENLVTGLACLQKAMVACQMLSTVVVATTRDGRIDFHC